MFVDMLHSLVSQIVLSTQNVECSCNDWELFKLFHAFISEIQFAHAWEYGFELTFYPAESGRCAGWFRGGHRHDNRNV